MPEVVGVTVEVPVGFTSVTAPPGAVSVTRPAWVVAQASVTASPGRTCPGRTSNRSIETITAGISWTRMVRESCPLGLVARSVKVAVELGVTVTGLALTGPGRGSIRSEVAPLTAKVKVIGIPTSGTGLSTLKLSITGGATDDLLEQAHAAISAKRRRCLMVAPRTSPGARR